MNIALNYTLADSVYTFDFGNGKKVLYPVSSVILVDDNSGLLSVKATATRKTLFLCHADVNEPVEDNEGNGSGGGGFEIPSN